MAFDEVATRAGIGRATLYRNPDLRGVIEEHRAADEKPRTLTGLATEIAHLRIALDALAVKVRPHEEQLRRLHQPDERTGS